MTCLLKVVQDLSLRHSAKFVNYLANTNVEEVKYVISKKLGAVITELKLGRTDNHNVDESGLTLVKSTMIYDGRSARAGLL
jgi:hypothetical protein